MLHLLCYWLVWTTTSVSGGAALHIINSLEHSASGAGPGMPRHKGVTIEARVSERACGGATPGRSLVPEAQAQPGAASTQLAAVRRID